MILLNVCQTRKIKYFCLFTGRILNQLSGDDKCAEDVENLGLNKGWYTTSRIRPAPRI